jgi:D-glycero-alpha-D-manno-heptose-7-phosphate kinase
MIEHVIGRSGCRFDLAGGTFDIWPLGVLHPGARTINVAIDVPVRVELQRRDSGYRLHIEEDVLRGETLSDFLGQEDGALFGLLAQALELPPVDVRLDSGSPRGGGLGASSAISMALIAAGEVLMGAEPRDPMERARLGRDVEARLMGLPTGTQDHLPPQLGGALELSYVPGGPVVRRLETDLAALGRCMSFFFTGRSHISAEANWQVIRRRLEGDSQTTRLFAGICEVATELGRSLETGDLEAVGRLMGEEWSYRRQLAEGVSTAEIETLLDAAADAGAWGGKAGGAGGGGCIGVLHPEETKEAVIDAVTAAGGLHLEAAPTSQGLAVEVKQ